MKLLLLVSLLVVGARSLYRFTRVMSADPSYSRFFQYDVPCLSAYYFDDTIHSVKQSGMWIYYENNNYNQITGDICYVYGLMINVNMSEQLIGKVSSLRFVGKSHILNTDSITFYEDGVFTGEAIVTEEGLRSLGPMAGRVSSLIIAGPSPWTVYRGENFTGMSLCMYPERSPAASLNGKLVFGIVHDIKRLDMPDNSIMSVKKGCDSRAASHKLIIEADGQNKDGAWRFFKHKA